MAPMLPDSRRLGVHLPIADGLVRVADRAVEIGATSLQVFSDHPSSRRRRAAPSPDLPAFRARIAAAGIAPLAIHASYLINLASSDPAYHERAVALLARELRAARRFGASIVNVHIGSHGRAGPVAGIERLVTAIGRALADEHEPEAGWPEDGDDAASNKAAAQPRPDPDGLRSAAPTITLENAAGSGSALGVDVDELSTIAHALGDAGLPAERIGFCLDTAHAWSAGHDLGEPRAIDAFVDAFDRHIGLDRLALVHLNDSKSERGSRVDRHEHLGAGRIGEIGLAHLLRHPGLADSAWILETPGMDEGYDAINLARAIALGRGEPLVPLPPGALSLRGGRSRRAAAAAPPEPVAPSGSAGAS
jgi:deoxyribonuclease IV